MSKWFVHHIGCTAGSRSSPFPAYGQICDEKVIGWRPLSPCDNMFTTWSKLIECLFYSKNTSNLSWGVLNYLIFAKKMWSFIYGIIFYGLLSIYKSHIKAKNIKCITYCGHLKPGGRAAVKLYSFQLLFIILHLNGLGGVWKWIIFAGRVPSAYTQFKLLRKNWRPNKHIHPKWNGFADILRVQTVRDQEIVEAHWFSGIHIGLEEILVWMLLMLMNYCGSHNSDSESI